MTALSTPELDGLLPREALSAGQRDEMFALLSRYFEGVTRTQFESDLAEKNWVVEIRRADQLLGFSTLLVREVSFEGEALTVIYSGDTIVAPEAWGTPALARNWISAVNQLRAAAPDRPCYWLLLTSGFRTYRFLPAFWREFFPCQGVSMPPREQRRLAHLARLQYGRCYDAPAGVVRFPRPQRLRSQLSVIPEGRTENAHVAFFLNHNPGYSDGDELVCLTRIDEANLTSAGRRVVASTQR